MSFLQKLRAISLKNREILVVFALIYFFAFSIRLINGFRQMNFWQDQARDAYLMRGFQEQGVKLVSYGPKASVGNFYLPPLDSPDNYFFSSISGFRPLVMQWVTVVVESFTPIVLFLILEKLSNRKLALICSLIYSVSFLPIVYGSSAWNPNMVPFFTSLSLYFFIRHLIDKSKWAIVAGILSIGVAVSFHYQAVVVIPFVLFVFLLSLRQSLGNFKYWLLGGLIFSLTLIPYVRAEIASDWSNGRAVIAYFNNVHSQYYDRITKPQFVLTFIPSFIERVLIGTNLPGILLGRITLLLGLALTAVAWKKNRKLGILLVYFALIVVMLRVYKGDKEDYYMSTLFILPSYFLAQMIMPFRRFTTIVLCFMGIMSGYLLFSRSSQRSFQVFEAASAYIQSQLPNKEGVVFFHDKELINLFAYAFKYQNPIKLNPTSNRVIDICLPGKPCDNRYRDVCFNNMSTEISIAKYANDYKQMDAIIYPTIEIVVGNFNLNSIEFEYSSTATRTDAGSDLLLKELEFK